MDFLSPGKVREVGKCELLVRMGGLRRRMSHDMGTYTWISILG